MNSPSDIEHEVPPSRRLKDLRLITDWLLRHPFIHFAVMFCYWFTAVSILTSLWVHLFHAESWTEGRVYFFSFFMAVVFYFIHRRRMKIGYDVWLFRWASRLGLRRWLDATVAKRAERP
jgi:hypothetical protein